MIQHDSNTFARRARLSTSAIALAMALTAAAIAAAYYSNGDWRLAGYEVDTPISRTAN